MPRYLLERYKRSSPGFTKPRPIDDLIRDMDEIGIDISVLLPIDCTVSLGKRMSNDAVAEMVRRFPGRLIGFAGVDPRMGKAAIMELEGAVKRLGVRGLKLHPCLQEFYPHDKQYYPLYEKCVELDIPIAWHCGFGLRMRHIYVGLLLGGSVSFVCFPLRMDIAHAA